MGLSSLDPSIIPLVSFVGRENIASKMVPETWNPVLGTLKSVFPTWYFEEYLKTFRRYRGQWIWYLESHRLYIETCVSAWPEAVRGTNSRRNGRCSAPTGKISKVVNTRGMVPDGVFNALAIIVVSENIWWHNAEPDRGHNFDQRWKLELKSRGSTREIFKGKAFELQLSTLNERRF